MKWLKFISVGLYVISAFKESVKDDGKISLKDIIVVGVEAARRAGFEVENINWRIINTVIK